MAESALRYTLDAHSDADVTALHVVGGPSLMIAERTVIAVADEPEQAAEEHAQEVLDEPVK